MYEGCSHFSSVTHSPCWIYGSKVLQGLPVCAIFAAL
jgi:hypothetical protein